MNLIKCNENSTLVNIDNVASIYPNISPDTNKRPHKIYFTHAAMNSHENMETVWEFYCIDRFYSVLSALEPKII